LQTSSRWIDGLQDDASSEVTGNLSLLACSGRLVREYAGTAWRGLIAAKIRATGADKNETGSRLKPGSGLYFRPVRQVVHSDEPLSRRQTI
jgi:hypothetical protein